MFSTASQLTLARAGLIVSALMLVASMSSWFRAASAGASPQVLDLSVYSNS
jgi:hypothetical protein